MLPPPLPQHADENLNFEDQILEAAKNIASATSTLVKSATAAQRELVAEGKLSSNPRSEDGQWSDGLVSAVSASVSPLSLLYMVTHPTPEKKSCVIPDLSTNWYAREQHFQRDCLNSIILVTGLTHWLNVVVASHLCNLLCTCATSVNRPKGCFSLWQLNGGYCVMQPPV